jgi:serine/threonine protein kinase
VITLRCPECRAPLDGSAGLRCGTHGLYGLDAAGLEHLPDHPLLGQLLDEKYALVGVLGQGGTGSVYRALQEPLGRPVGVKLLHAAFLAAKDGRDRFEREARALASLSSLHTVRLLDYGISRQGPMALRNIAYLVMELLEGEDLQARMVRGPMAPVDVLALLDALADSLDEAHAAGIVHRDLKPSNIVLTRRRDGREVLKLIDFGIARIEGTSHTEQGRVSGTPFYMAPEQARGMTRRVLRPMCMRQARCVTSC